MNKVSYSLGLSIASNFKATGIKNIDKEQFFKGFKDAMDDHNLEISYEDAQKIINEYFGKLQEEQSELATEAGKEFLKINGERKEVHTLPSGLQYEIIKEGTGKKPSVEDTVECHYEGSLINGKVFDSSYKRGQTAEFGLNQVIKGWTEALQLMSEGSKWKLFIPSELAYGAQGAGQAIGPHETLIFDVELIKVK